MFSVASGQDVFISHSVTHFLVPIQYEERFKQSLLSCYSELYFPSLLFSFLSVWKKNYSSISNCLPNKLTTNSFLCFCCYPPLFAGTSDEEIIVSINKNYSLLTHSFQYKEISFVLFVLQLVFPISYIFPFLSIKKKNSLWFLPMDPSVEGTLQSDSWCFFLNLLPKSLTFLENLKKIKYIPWKII